MRATIACIILAAPALAQPHRVESMWAEPGMLQNPVAICFDPWGNLYVAETDRAGNAVQDTRNLHDVNGMDLHPVEEDLQLHSVEDRRALIQKWVDMGAFEPDYFTRTEDRVRRLADTDGDGVADESTVFAGGFNDALDGIGAGVLWLDDALYFTCIPHLWKLPDADHDGAADSRESLSYGYGVRWCFYGHDMHGLTLGPDGRIYFSIGDRGFNVTTKEGNHLVGTQTGGVFRCWPDGSGLELFYQGLRNPQELTFDQYGNLFTGDNNCDSGDKARVHQIVEGGDSGWRQDVQSLDSRGPWNREHIWELVSDYPTTDPARPAWAIPPIAHVGAGPSGIAYYPGTGESHDLDDHILLVDFYGSGSTVHAFEMKPHGAWFDLTDHTEYYKGKTVTDIAFGYDGRLYLSDWGGGWSPNPNGHVFTITNTDVHADPGESKAIAEVATLFQEGFAERSMAELLALLDHRDQRVRLAAQYEIAQRDASAQLTTLASDTSAPRIQRVHAIWAIGQIARHDDSLTEPLAALAHDDDPEIRTQSIKLLADLHADLPDLYLVALHDDNAQTRFYGALALGETHTVAAIDPLLQLLDDNADADPMIRHAASYALTLINRPDDLIERASSHGPSARIGIVIALRRLDNIGLAAFLTDDDPRVAIEAARAIYDRNLETALPALARLLDTDIPADRAIEPLMRRAIEANVLLATPEAADRLAAFAARPTTDPTWRALALQRLAEWNQPLQREGVWGHWVDMPARDDAALADAVLAHAEGLAANATDETSASIVQSLLAAHEPDLTIDETLVALADPARSEAWRAAMLDRLAARAPDRTAEAALSILDASESTGTDLTTRALSHLATADPDAAIERIQRIVDRAPLDQQQRAIRLLPTIDTPAARTLLTHLLKQLEARDLDPGVALDVYLAGLQTPDSSMTHTLAAQQGSWSHPDLPFASAILAAGGDPEHGRDVFLHHGAAQCLRCHTVDHQGGTAGPDLTFVASRRTTDQLIESVVQPGATISPGYATISVTLNDGDQLAGTLLEDRPDGVVLDVAGEHRTIPASSIRARSAPVSAMPVMPGLLTPLECRDVIAYLGTRVDPNASRPAPADAQTVRTATDVTEEPHHMSLWTIVTLIVVGAFVIATLFILATGRETPK